MKVVIIGGVAGGASCAARLRRLDEEADIVVLERGPYVSYANCGLPYHIGNVISEKNALLLQSPEAMQKKYKLDVRVKSEATVINRERKTVTVKGPEGTTEEAYDKLVLATGSSPLRPPIPGMASPRIRTLWTVPDAEDIRALTQEQKGKRAVVIGGGFIGLETAENLKEAGLDVTIVEQLNQVMAPLDYEMALLVHQNLLDNGVELILKDGVASFEDDGSTVLVKLQSGRTVPAGLVILAMGVRPNSSLAKEAGLQLNEKGGVVVNEFLETSDPDIYAVGDVIQVNDLIWNTPTMIPLAGPANKQGRIAADNLSGMREIYKGTQGTSVAKVFDLTVASTGSNEKTLQNKGMVKGKDYETATLVQNSHASYYPGAIPMTIKLLFALDGSRIFGAQIVGCDLVDKRIDTIATVIRLGGSVEDLKELELAYAPPYSSAKDPVNMAGFVADNVIKGLVRLAAWDAPDKRTDAVLLDVREPQELVAFSVPEAVSIPLGQVRSRLGELDKEKPVIIFCAIGVRAYLAARILMQNGFTKVEVYPGGSRFYQGTHFEKAEVTKSGMIPPVGKEPQVKLRLNCNGMQCPGPIMKVFESMQTMKDGETLEISASDPGFVKDIDAWCKHTGNTLLARGRQGQSYTALVQKGTDTPAPQMQETGDGKTIIVFSGDLDKVLASFIIANGAAAMGRKVTMFFTFWGLTVLRKAQKQPVKKTLVESMFGFMLPRGSKKLKLSRMNMGGMGTAMMRKIMQDKNVDSLEDLIKKAMQNGVKIVACTMSMDVMGIRKEELIDGVELAGVGSYLGDAEESNVNLFI